MPMPRACGFDEDFGLRDDAGDGAPEPGLRQYEDRRPARRCALWPPTQPPGGRVSWSRVSLVQVLSDSIALPVLPSPVSIEGRRLMDGFVSNPLPVSEARDAQAVVALGFEAPMPRRIDGPSRSLRQVTSAMSNSLMHANLNAAKASGMNPPGSIRALGRRVGLFDTEAMPSLVEVGRRIAQGHLEQIREQVQAADAADRSMKSRSAAAMITRAKAVTNER